MAEYLDYSGLVELVSKLKAYTDGKIGDLDLDIFVICTTLPSQGIANKIYLVPSATTATYNKYDEYTWLVDESTWEYFGEAHLDVDVEQLLENYVKTVSASGTAPLTLSASKSGNTLTITGSISAATSTANGYMSSADKSKLDSMSLDTVVQKATATGTAPLTLNADIASGTLTITGSIAAATTSAAGTMSAADKTKLDALDNSLVVQHATASGDSPLILNASISNGTLTITGSITAATQSANGYMSASDKTKLDSMALETVVQSVTATGTAPLTLGATISNGALAITGSIAASSAGQNGYMSSTQYTQLANLVADSLCYATAITTAEIDALFD